MRDSQDNQTLELPGMEPEHYPMSGNRRTMPHRSKNAMEAQQQLELLEPTDNSGLPLWTRDENTDLTGLPIWAKD
ncbi:MAG: hypothetical protein V4634_10500 [Pseudomonadota bacterium]